LSIKDLQPSAPADLQNFYKEKSRERFWKAQTAKSIIIASARRATMAKLHTAIKNPSTHRMG